MDIGAVVSAVYKQNIAVISWRERVDVRRSGRPP